MSGDYKNAKQLLPKELYEEVCKYGEGHWWFPPLGSDEKSKIPEQILRLKLRGLSNKEVAEQVGRSERRVQQVLSKGFGEMTELLSRK